MEDVVLRWRRSDDLRSLIQTTQKLLEPFPLRTPPPFTPWCPAAASRPLPIRPSKRPPIITLTEEKSPPESERVAQTTTTRPPASRTAAQGSSPPSWSVSTQTKFSQNGERPVDKRLHAVLLDYRLHPLQRARWVISRHNCGPTRNLEQVWRSLCRLMRRAALPTCNANIQRQRAEIWVFCDVQQAERAGRHLKGALQLSGTISLSVSRMTNILSV